VWTACLSAHRAKDNMMTRAYRYAQCRSTFYGLNSVLQSASLPSFDSASSAIKRMCCEQRVQCYSFTTLPAQCKQGCRYHISSLQRHNSQHSIFSNNTHGYITAYMGIIHTARRFATASSSPSSSSDNVDAETPRTEYHRPNKALSSIIREGYTHLNEAASFIQNSKYAQRPLMYKAPNADMTGEQGVLGPPPTDSQLLESARMWRVANECLQEMSRKDSTLCIGGEPIVLLNVHIKPSLRSAHVIWTLPQSVMWNRELTFVQKEWLQFRMQQVIEGGGGAKLQRRVSAVLRKYHPPLLHFKAANQAEIKEAFEMFLDSKDESEGIDNVGDAVDSADSDSDSDAEDGEDNQEDDEVGRNRVQK
jgi:hypothetical protein